MQVNKLIICNFCRQIVVKGGPWGLDLLPNFFKHFAKDQILFYYTATFREKIVLYKL